MTRPGAGPKRRGRAEYWGWRLLGAPLDAAPGRTVKGSGYSAHCDAKPWDAVQGRAVKGGGSSTRRGADPRATAEGQNVEGGGSSINPGLELGSPREVRVPRAVGPPLQDGHPSQEPRGGTRAAVAATRSAATAPRIPAGPAKGRKGALPLGRVHGPRRRPRLPKWGCRWPSRNF